jgi:hypothetical protein
VASLSGKHSISLLEVDSPFPYSRTEEQFDTFKMLVSAIGLSFLGDPQQDT